MRIVSLMKKIAFTFLLLTLSSFAQSSNNINTRDGVYYDGEQIVLAIPEEELPSEFKFNRLPWGVESDLSAEFSFDGNNNQYSFEIVQAQVSENAKSFDWHLVQNVWLNLIATASRNKSGEFSGHVVIKKLGCSEQSVKFPFSFKVSSFPVASPNGVAVLFGDSAAGHTKQIDIDTYIKSTKSTKVPLQNSYVDYYLTKSVDNAPYFDIWYNNSKDDLSYHKKDLCVKIYKCGEKNFVVRQYLRGEWIFPLGNPMLISQIGYREDSASGKLFSRIVDDKFDNGSKNQYLDYSYGVPALSYSTQAYQRHAHYNNKMALYSEKNELLWGSSPTWLDGKCVEAKLKVDYVTEVQSDFWCDDSDFDDSAYEPGSPVSSSSSSTPVLTSSDLVVRFLDVVYRDSYYTNRLSDSYNTNVVNLFFDIYNKGEHAQDISNYEVRFFYSENEKLNNGQNLIFESFNNGLSLKGESKRCSDKYFALTFKLPQNMVLQPKTSVENQGNLHYINWSLNDIGKMNFYSWVNVLDVTENPRMGLFDAQGNRVYGSDPCNSQGSVDNPGSSSSSSLSSSSSFLVEVYSKYTPSDGISNAKANYGMKIKYEGNEPLIFPISADFYFKHDAGKVPVFSGNKKVFSTANAVIALNSNVSVLRFAISDRHVLHFTFNSKFEELKFDLKDQCYGDCVSKDMKDDEKTKVRNFFAWNLDDDWSVMDLEHDGKYYPTENVVLKDATGKKLFGNADPGVPLNVQQTSDGKLELKHERANVDDIAHNRTDLVSYSGGQLVSGGDFEDPSLVMWGISGEVKSVRGTSPQGSRHAEILAGGSAVQVLPLTVNKLLSDSGATLVFWHMGNYIDVNVNGQEKHFSPSKIWIADSIYFEPSVFDNDVVTIRFSNHDGAAASSSAVAIDHVVLVPGRNVDPITYATRFTNASGAEAETRAYDGDALQLVKTSTYDELGRLSRSFLPFALDCKSVEECNSDMKTLSNPAMAMNFYNGSNKDYPNANGYPYKEMVWKKDPLSVEDYHSLPGKGFSLEGDDKGKHLKRTYSSGVNMSYYDSLDFWNLRNNLISAEMYYDAAGEKRYRAKLSSNPTHLWEMTEDEDGRKSVTVSDADGKIIVAGALNKDGLLESHSVNVYDARGNLVKVHSPVSCEYYDYPNKWTGNCVNPSQYWYDEQNRLIKSKEPDAGTSLSFYDYTGRLRATQTQNQIGKMVSVVGYDTLDRIVFTGEWATTMSEAQLRNHFNSESNLKVPGVDDLVLGTVTRTFYDRMPECDTLSVKLCPASMNNTDFQYLRGRVAAVVSDVEAPKNDAGSPLQAADGGDSVVRVSTSTNYDKYGRVLATYAFDPTIIADSLRMLATENKYDLGGKLVFSLTYPYGLTKRGVDRAFLTQYAYDRLGRIDYINVQKGGVMPASLARYEYYPTGAVKRVTLGDAIAIDYTYHISGAMKTAVATNLANNSTLFSETLYYEDCGSSGCTPQYNGNISRMVQSLAHGNTNYKEARDVMYAYDFMNRLTGVDDLEQDDFDEYFAYDAQGRITSQRRGANARNSSGGEYNYYAKTNELRNVANGMGGSADKRDMSASDNFEYDAEGNMTKDNSKDLTIAYDWRGMPVEFKRFRCTTTSYTVCDSVLLRLAYDGSGRRISKTRMMKTAADGDWYVNNVTHYTGIGTEVRESYFGGALDNAKVVMNLPEGLGRYTPEDAVDGFNGVGANQRAGYRPPAKFEWYLKNHIGSTMLVYGTSAYSDPLNSGYKGGVKAAYDYRAFGEQVDLTVPAEKVTENFTGKEKDDETELNYFGARYLDPMLGLWTSVDAKRQYQNPYLYAGNNPIMRVDPDGNQDDLNSQVLGMFMNQTVKPQMETANEMLWDGTLNTLKAEGTVAKYGLVAVSVFDPEPSTRFMASAAVMGLDMLEGGLENGSAGALGAGLIDGIGMFLPDKTIPSRMLNQFAVDGAQKALGECLSTYFENKDFVRQGEIDVMPLSQEISQDNTRTR